MLRRILSLCLAFVLIFGIVGCSGTYVPNNDLSGITNHYPGDASTSSNRYTHVDDHNLPSVLEGMNTDGYTLVAENDLLALFIREEVASIRVVNKQSGYVWGALREDDPDDLNRTWASFASSIVSIKYYDETGNITQIGAGHRDNKCTFEYVDGGVICHVQFKKSKISLSAKVELEEDHLCFSLDDSSIKEEGEFVLGQVYFCPFFGSTVSDEIGGYMFVPDGSGALIRFQKSTKYLTGYADRIYGSDLAIDNLFVLGDLNSNRTNDYMRDPETITMPVYGISHGYNANAFFGYVEQGAEFGAIFAEPAGTITDYNYAGAYFIYRQVYLQPTGRDGAGIQMVQQKPNAVDPRLNVYFLHGNDANYNGMASCYRKILENKALLSDRTPEKPTFTVDFLVADIRKGFLFDTTAKLTDSQHLLNAAEYLQNAGIKTATFNLLGWQTGGLNGYKKLRVFTHTEMGSLSDIAQVRAKLREYGIDLSMYLAPLTAKETQVFNKKEQAITLSQSVIEKKRDNDNIYLPDTLYLKTDEAIQVMQQQIQKLKEAGLESFSVDKLAGILYAEHLRDEVQTRSEVLALTVSAMKELAGEKKLTLFGPNEYLLGITGIYREVPMSSSRYTFESDSVPFLQLVLSGEMTMYAPYANQSFYTDTDVLKCIEYNAYPTFIMTGLGSGELADTPSEEYFSTCFDDWKETAVSIYQRIDIVLSNVHGQRMVSHTAVREGVMKIVYETGAVYVNYTDEAIVLDGITVNARSAVYASGVN